MIGQFLMTHQLYHPGEHAQKLKPERGILEIYFWPCFKTNFEIKVTPRLHRWQIKESSWIIQDHPKNEKPLPSINIQNQFLDLTKKIFQRARRPRRARRVPHKVDKSLQCNIQQTNQLPSDLPNQVGFCKLCFLLLSRNSYGLEYFFYWGWPWHGFWLLFAATTSSKIFDRVWSSQGHFTPESDSAWSTPEFKSEWGTPKLKPQTSQLFASR